MIIVDVVLINGVVTQRRDAGTHARASPASPSLPFTKNRVVVVGVSLLAAVTASFNEYTCSVTPQYGVHAIMGRGMAASHVIVTVGWGGVGWLHVMLQEGVVHDEDEGAGKGDADVDEDGSNVDTELTIGGNDEGVVQYQVEDVYV